MNIKQLRGISIILELIVAALAGMLPRSASATPADYTFTQIATLGDPAPGSGEFTFDFEPWGINNRGDVVFAADVSTGGEGIFLRSKRQLSQIARTGQPAPGGGTFAFVDTLSAALNDVGDLAMTFFLEPFTHPLGLNSGVYRFSHIDKTLSAVVVPGVTPAPGGGTFVGATIHASLNNGGDMAFAGITTEADIAPGPPGVDGLGLGKGVFRADKRGQIFTVMRPGDPAPGGRIFDDGQNPWINARGDVAFDAHLQGDECIAFAPQTDRIFCAPGIYVKKVATGEVRSIVHQGEPAPGGGTYRLAFGPVLNNRGDIVFIGDLTPAPGFGQDLAVFLHSKGTTIPVARPGNPMPGGGHLLTAAFFVGTYNLNNAEEVSFLGALDTDVNGDGIADTGLFVWSHGTLRLVARTGTVIPGVGTVAHLNNPFNVDCQLSVRCQPSSLFNGADINERGQVLTSAILTNGQVVLLVATPSS